MSPKFTKQKEDFICEHCGREVKGTGYTNHCPHCLWSKHRDINPGDRQSDCGGLMRPADLYYLSGEWTVIHQCQLCGYRTKNKISPEDDFDEVIRLENEINNRKAKG